MPPFLRLKVAQGKSGRQRLMVIESKLYSLQLNLNGLLGALFAHNLYISENKSSKKAHERLFMASEKVERVTFSRPQW